MQLTTTASSIRHTEFSAWYPLFIGCTIKSKILALPDDFIRWLKTDGVSLPPGTPVSIFHETLDDDEQSWASGGDSGDHIDEGTLSTDSEPLGEESVFDFRQLNDMVAEAVASLGGAVMPKLNWSAPQDAVWMNQGTMRCTAAGDIYLLLKASDFVAHDLHYPFDGCNASPLEQQSTGTATAPTPPTRIEAMDDANESMNIQYTLVLRKWSHLVPQMNFRGFARERRLVALCQRECSAYYPSLVDDADRIQACITRFFYEKVAHRFLDPNFVMDVYVDKHWRVWIVDFNVYAERTDSLLFSWEEPLLSGEGVMPSEAELRLVESDVCVRGGSLAQYRAPIEMHAFLDSQRGQETHDDGDVSFSSFLAKCEAASDVTG